MKLAHEDDDHLLFWIDGKRGVEKSRPIELAGRAQLRERGLNAIDAEAETKVPVWRNFAQLVVRHELNRFAAEDADVA